MKGIGLATAAIALACAPAAAHSEPVPQTNHFTLDLYQGPILAPIRVAAMGGAYTGYAQGIGAFPVNAAAPAVRHDHSTSWLEIDADASLSFPIAIGRNNDIDDSGDSSANWQRYIYLAAAGMVQAGNFGFGVFGDLQRYSISFPPSEAQTVVTVGRYHALLAYQFFGDQLVVGAGARMLSLTVSAPGSALSTDLGVFGASPEVGLLIKPDWSPFRIGASYRHTVSGLSVSKSAQPDDKGVLRAGGLIVPDKVDLPWELGIGAAFQIGPRPLNPKWINPHEHEHELAQAYRDKAKARRQRDARLLAGLPEGSERAELAKKLAADERAAVAEDARSLQRDQKRLEAERRAILANWPREYLLVTADLLVTGPVERGVGMARFLGQGYPLPAGPCQVVASGQEVNYSPRVGLEIEPVPQWLHARFGSYYEPNRFGYQPEVCNDRIGRQHFTFGADVRTFTTTWWGLVTAVTYKLQVAADLAPRYQSFSGGFGVWY